VGLAITFDVLVADNPVAGDQVYDVAPDAVRFTLLPEQIVAVEGETPMTGTGKTDKLTELTGPTHPFIVPKTV
jgi:hypothetical protein